MTHPGWQLHASNQRWVTRGGEGGTVASSAHEVGAEVGDEIGIDGPRTGQLRQAFLDETVLHGLGATLPQPLPPPQLALPAPAALVSCQTEHWRGGHGHAQVASRGRAQAVLGNGRERAGEQVAQRGAIGAAGLGGRSRVQRDDQGVRDTFERHLRPQYDASAFTERGQVDEVVDRPVGQHVDAIEHDQQLLVAVSWHRRHPSDSLEHQAQGFKKLVGTRGRPERRAGARTQQPHREGKYVTNRGRRPARSNGDVDDLGLPASTDAACPTRQSDLALVGVAQRQGDRRGALHDDVQRRFRGLSPSGMSIPERSQARMCTTVATRGAS